MVWFFFHTWLTYVGWCIKYQIVFVAVKKQIFIDYFGVTFRCRLFRKDRKRTLYKETINLNLPNASEYWIEYNPNVQLFAVIELVPKYEHDKDENNTAQIMPGWFCMESRRMESLLFNYTLEAEPQGYTQQW